MTKSKRQRSVSSAPKLKIKGSIVTVHPQDVGLPIQHSAYAHSAYFIISVLVCIPSLYSMSNQTSTPSTVPSNNFLLQTNTYYQNVIDKFDAAFAALVPVFDEGRIVDFYFKTTNEAYSKYSNMSPAAIQGKRVSAVFPGYYKTDAFERYVQISNRESHKAGSFIIMLMG
jgi:hypothetical protein